MDRIEDFFWKHMYGDWESVTRPIWIYGHVSIPIVYLYKRYEKAQHYKVQSETPIEPGEEYDPSKKYDADE